MKTLKQLLERYSQQFEERYQDDLGFPGAGHSVWILPSQDHSLNWEAMENGGTELIPADFIRLSCEGALWMSWKKWRDEEDPIDGEWIKAIGLQAEGIYSQVLRRTQ